MADCSDERTIAETLEEAEENARISNAKAHDGGVSVSQAEEDFHELERELSLSSQNLSKKPIARGASTS